MRVKSVAVRSESPWWERYSICVCVMVFLLACFKACVMFRFLTTL